MPTEAAIREIWIVSLVAYGVVVVVVAILLAMILRAARAIHAGVASIWTVGQKVANNTIHISLLDSINHIAGGILGSAGNIVGATALIDAHARSCPGCPACVLKRR